MLLLFQGIYDMCTEDAWLAHHKHSSDHTVGVGAHDIIIIFTRIATKILVIRLAYSGRPIVWGGREGVRGGRAGSIKHIVLGQQSQFG